MGIHPTPEFMSRMNQVIMLVNSPNGSIGDSSDVSICESDEPGNNTRNN